MQRIFHHYEKWEDWQNGLFKSPDRTKEEAQIEQARSLLSNRTALFNAMGDVVEKWQCAAEVNLSNRSMNRQAWLGQAACCYMYGIPEDTTKAAWRLLGESEQTEANKIADIVITHWENKNTHA